MTRRGRATTMEDAELARRRWLIEVRLEKVVTGPQGLLTDHPVETAGKALRIFRMDCQRWATEDAVKVGTACLGWEGVQEVAFEAVSLLAALGWVAGGFLSDLGVALEWGGSTRPPPRDGEDRPSGKIVLMRRRRS